jgi:hypothetical protein
VTRDADRDALEDLAVRIAAALGEDGVLVGGLAVAAWGYVRATDDVDFAAQLPARVVVEKLDAVGIPSQIRKGAGLLEDGIEWCVRGEVKGVLFDVPSRSGSPGGPRCASSTWTISSGSSSRPVGRRTSWTWPSSCGSTRSDWKTFAPSPRPTGSGTNSTAG